MRTVHSKTADNVDFQPERYTYGARHVVKVLLEQYYNVNDNFRMRAYFNFRNNANKYKQHKIYTYAKVAYSKRTTTEQNEFIPEKWKNYSFNDILR